MGKMFFWENEKCLIRNYDERIRMAPGGAVIEVIKVPGEVTVFRQTGKGENRKAKLEVLAPETVEKKKGLVLAWLKPREVKAALVAFALGAWAVWTAITIAMLANT